MKKREKPLLKRVAGDSYLLGFWISVGVVTILWMIISKLFVYLGFLKIELIYAGTLGSSLSAILYLILIAILTIVFGRILRKGYKKKQESSEKET